VLDFLLLELPTACGICRILGLPLTRLTLTELVAAASATADDLLCVALAHHCCYLQSTKRQNLPMAEADLRPAQKFTFLWRGDGFTYLFCIQDRLL